MGNRLFKNKKGGGGGFDESQVYDFQRQSALLKLSSQPLSVRMIAAASTIKVCILERLLHLFNSTNENT